MPITLEDAFSMDNLRLAFRRVRSNKGGPGADGVSIADIGLQEAAVLERLAGDVLTGRYAPHRLRPVPIPKRSGGQRYLRIPSVRDRIAQTALLKVLLPEIDCRFHDNSFAYRPGRSVAGAFKRMESWNCLESWIVDLDIESYFDSIDHRRLRLDLTYWISDPEVLALLLVWLENFSVSGRGVAQGSPISPFFSNVFLHPVVCLLAAQGIRAVRYADDVVIVAPSRKSARRDNREFERLLAHRGLSKNVAKSAILPPGKPFVYLGKQFGLQTEEAW